MSALPVPDGLEAILLVIRYSTYPPDISVFKKCVITIIFSEYCSNIYTGI